MGQISAGRWTVFVALSIVSCKARVANNESAVKADGRAAQAAGELAGLCQKSGSKKFLKALESGSLEYTKRPGSKSENGWENWNEGVATLDKEQPDTPFWRVSVPFGADDQVPFCLVGRTSLSTAELAAALDCSDQDPCLAEGGTVHKTFRGDGDLAGTGDQAEPGTKLELAGASVSCQGNQLVGVKGQKIGQPIPDRLGGAERCDLLAKAHVDGRAVCGFNGKGFTPFGVDLGTVAGGQQQPENLQLCADEVRTARGSRVCALDDRTYRIYDLNEQDQKGVAADTGEGTFFTLDECSAFLGDSAQSKKKLKLAGSPVDNLDLTSADIPNYYGAFFNGGADRGSVQPSSCRDTSADRDGFVFFSQCRVDVVYSWGPMVKIRDLERQMGAGGWDQASPILRFDKNKASPIFTTHSAIGSHGYGEVAIRIKLKPNVQYVRGGFQSGCNILSDPSTQVVERYAGRSEWNFIELIICAPGPVHSWSYFSKEHYDEVAMETRTVWPQLKQVTTDLYGEGTWPLYFKVLKNWGMSGVGIDDTAITNYRRHMFKARLEQLARSSRAGLQRLYFNPEVRDSATAADHFVPRVAFNFHATKYVGGNDGVDLPDPVDVGIPCETVRGKTYSGGKRAVTFNGDCSDYTRPGVYVGANRGVATAMTWTIDSTVSPSRIQVQITEGPIKGDVFFYTVSSAGEICFAGQTVYKGPTTSCMSI